MERTTPRLGTRSTSSRPRQGRPSISPEDRKLRELLRRLFSSSSLSREQIADALSQKLQERVSLSRLEQFVASTKLSSRIPMYFLPVLSEILNTDAILLHLARAGTRGRVELAEHVRELRRIADELLAHVSREGRDA